MGIVSTILGILAVLATLVFLFALLVLIRLNGCKNCIHFKKCARETRDKKGRVPECIYYENSFFNNYN